MHMISYTLTNHQIVCFAQISNMKAFILDAYVWHDMKVFPSLALSVRLFVDQFVSHSDRLKRQLEQHAPINHCLYRMVLSVFMPVCLCFGPCVNSILYPSGSRSDGYEFMMNGSSGEVKQEGSSGLSSLNKLTNLRRGL